MVMKPFLKGSPVEAISAQSPTRHTCTAHVVSGVMSADMRRWLMTEELHEPVAKYEGPLMQVHFQ